MLIKLLFVAALIFLVGRNLLKLVDKPEVKHTPGTKPGKKKQNDDAIDADFTVIDDDK